MGIFVLHHFLTLFSFCELVELNTRAAEATIDHSDEEDDDDDEEDIVEVHGGHAGEEILPHTLTFNPLYVMSSWKHSITKDARVSVALLVPSGIGEIAGDLKVTVEEEDYLSVGVPSALILNF